MQKVWAESVAYALGAFPHHIADKEVDTIPLMDRPTHAAMR
jgi:hypothetical protein